MQQPKNSARSPVRYSGLCRSRSIPRLRNSRISNRGPGAVFWLLYTDVFILVRSTFCFLDNNFIVRCISFISLSYVKIFYCWLFVLDILFCWKQACILGRNCLYYIFSFLFLFLCSTDSGIFHFIKFIYT